jgi:hypothetical protein
MRTAGHCGTIRALATAYAGVEDFGRRIVAKVDLMLPKAFALFNLTVLPFYGLTQKRDKVIYFASPHNGDITLPQSPAGRLLQPKA